MHHSFRRILAPLLPGSLLSSTRRRAVDLPPNRAIILRMQRDVQLQTLRANHHRTHEHNVPQFSCRLSFSQRTPNRFPRQFELGRCRQHTTATDNMIAEIKLLPAQPAAVTLLAQIRRVAMNQRMQNRSAPRPRRRLTSFIVRWWGKPQDLTGANRIPLAA